uniref:Eukaryotic translation initiation factor 3 subunit C (Trinotate prediction) n=1 Tax=Myxobolus squamalis TaxID=59785 RepID=A0A6B2FWC6_MYXSQ
MGNCIHIIFKINDELNKIMQSTDCFSIEYLNKMKDVFFFTNLISILQSYVESRGTVYQICEVYLLRVENLYYKLDFNWLVSLKDQLSGEISIDTTTITQNNVSDENLVNTLCQYLFKYGKERVPLRAALCQVYHHAIHDRWHRAKHLFLMSRIQEGIQHNDISTHILYNRVLVQLGLCAFRHGYFREALNALRDIQLTGRSKELLAQGLIMKNTERSLKQELLERRQLLPFHMHINLELVECVYLVSILALEGAYSIAPTQEQRNKFNSRGFVYLTRNIEKLAIHGPPETMREYVYAAFKSLCVGDWKTCISHIKSMKCWKLLVHSDSVLSILTKKLKQECLAAYIFANCRAYSKITFSYLLDKFQLSEGEIKSTINRLIIYDHFPAKWNQETTVLTIFQDMLPNNSHFLISAILDRLDNLNDQQQRSVDIMNIVNSTKEKYFSKSKAN